MNNAPSAPLISGPTSGEAGVEYTYLFSASDSDSDDIYYSIFWGDGEIEEWLGPYESGYTLELSHIWDEEGTYTISARAKDIWDVIGEWGTLEVTMPVNQLSVQKQSNLLKNIQSKFLI